MNSTARARPAPGGRNRGCSRKRCSRATSEEWAGPFGKYAEFERGLLHVDLFLEEMPSPEMLDDDTLWAWVDQVVLHGDPDPGTLRLLASPQMRWLTGLGHQEACPDETLLALAASPDPLKGNGPTHDGALALAGSHSLGRLRRLEVLDNTASEDGKRLLRERLGERVVC